MPNVMRRFRIDELSAVDRPAQAPARKLLMKRRSDASGDLAGAIERVAKDCDSPSARVVVITSATNGHTHAVWLYPNERGGDTGYGQVEGEAQGHSHPWTMNQVGQLVVGENDGHTHEVDSAALTTALLGLIGKKGSYGGSANDNTDDEEADGKPPAFKGDRKMAAANKNAPEADKTEAPEIKAPTQEMLDEATKRAERAEAVAALPVEHRAVFDGLSKGDQDAFLAKSADERVTFVKNASDADPIVYTSLAGKTYRKSAAPELIDAIKGQDELTKRLNAAEEVNANASFAKRAGEIMDKLPGDEKVHVAIVKAIDGIADETVRKAAFEAITAGNKAMTAAFNSTGHGDGRVTKSEGDTPAAQLDAIAKRHQSADPKLGYLDAYEKAKTENPELYAAAVTGKPVSK